MIHNEFTQTVINIIKEIPMGKVLSYGTIAGMAGNPRGARQVSWILHSVSRKYNLPWWRVVNSEGIITLRSAQERDSQRAKLEQEGVEFIEDYRINLDQHY